MDICAGCMSSTRPVAEVVEAIRKVAGKDGLPWVSAEDVIPERTRPRRAQPKSG